MTEKTFDELIKETPSIKQGLDDFFGKQTVINLMQQVREATIREIENLSNEYDEYGTADYVHEMPTDRIKITDND